MIDTIYVEEEAYAYEKTREILARFSGARVIECSRYGEVFNRKQQQFRLQKKNPALILAVKHGKRVLPIPDGYSIGNKHNFYFSHLLNCPFDCSYCFLQGMYRSAHFVLFVNFEDFQSDIQLACSEEKTTFFSGYDGDSLALEHISHFTTSFIPFFSKLERAEMELRTKSVAINHLLEQNPPSNVIVAYSLNPDPVAKRYEPKTPSLRMRMNAIKKLQERGWKIGLRFDPVLFVENFEHHYSTFFQDVFAQVPEPHSVTLGSFRMPKELYKQIRSAAPNNLVVAADTDEQKILSFCSNEIRKHIKEERFFPCQIVEQRL